MAMLFFYSRLAQDGLQVRLGSGDRFDAEVLHQYIEDIGGDEGRQRGSEMDVLDPQAEQGQEDDHRLLLVPGKDHGQGQIIDPAFKGAGQGHRNLDGGVGVIALTNVQQTRDAADIAQLLVKEAELAAGQGQDHAVGRDLFDQLGVVVAAGFGAITAADQEEVTDGLGFHSLDHLVGHAEYGVAGKADEHGIIVDGVGESGQGQGPVDQRGEVLCAVGLADMGDIRPADQAGGEDIGLVGILGLLDAVGGEEDGPWKFRHLLLLILPGGAEVAVEVAVLLQLGIAVAGQHLAMGVDVDALVLGLLQEHGQIFEVMAGDQDTLAGDMTQRHRGRNRMAVGAGVAGVQQLHGPEVDLAAFEGEGHQRIEIHVAGEGGHGLMDVGVDRIIFLAEDGGMIGIGGKAAQAVHGGLLQGLQVGIGIEGVDEVEGGALLFQTGQGIGRGKGGCGGGKINLAAGGLYLGLQGFTQGDSLVDQDAKAGRVKIDIGEAGKNSLTGETVNRVINNPDLAAGVSHQAQPLDGMGEKIFESCHFLVLAADTDGGTGDSLGGLFTLIAVHGYSPWLG